MSPKINHLDQPRQWRTPITEDLGAPGEAWPGPPARNGHDEKPPVTLKIVKGSQLAKTPAKPREWEVPDIIPAARVTGFCGDGAGGKSLSALQLGIAQTTGTDWFGKLPRKGRCMIMSCEDDCDEMQRRLHNIIAGRDYINLDDLDNLEIIDMVGENSILATPDRTMSFVPTAVYLALDKRLNEFMGPYPEGSDEGRLLILDTTAKVYGGDENVRGQVTQFIGFLEKLAIKYHVAIVLLMHPSLAGIASGTGSSGSTGWNGSMRARMYLTSVLGDKGDEPDPCLRQLKIMKSNYGAYG